MQNCLNWFRKVHICQKTSPKLCQNNRANLHKYWPNFAKVLSRLCLKNCHTKNTFRSIYKKESKFKKKKTSVPAGIEFFNAFIFCVLKCFLQVCYIFRNFQIHFFENICCIPCNIYVNNTKQRKFLKC